VKLGIVIANGATGDTVESARSLDYRPAIVSSFVIFASNIDLFPCLPTDIANQESNFVGRMGVHGKPKGVAKAVGVDLLANQVIICLPHLVTPGSTFANERVTLRNITTISDANDIAMKITAVLRPFVLFLSGTSVSSGHVQVTINAERHAERKRKQTAMFELTLRKW